MLRKVMIFSCILLTITMFSCDDKKTNPDTEAPTVVIIYPLNNSEFLSGVVINIVAEAEDNDEVDKVELYIDGNKVDTDYNLPYNYDWDTIDLTGNHTIYAKAFDNSENETLSDIVTIILNENHLQTLPSNPNPADNAENIIINPILTWDCSDPDGDILVYDVYFGTDSTPDNGELLSIEQDSTTFTTDVLINENTYYWKIVARDTLGYETVSPVWNFTTIEFNDPPVFTDNWPKYNSTTYIETYISWVCDDPENDPLTYDVYFGSIEDPPLVSFNQNAAFYNTGYLSYSTTYYYRIVAKDNENETTLGIIQFNTTDQEPSPSNPILVGSFDVEEFAASCFVLNNIAYLAVENDGLMIIDVSIPSYPQLLSTYNTSHAVSIFVVDDYAFLGCGSEGMKIINVSDPANPQLMSVLDTYTREIYIQDEICVIAASFEGIKIINISNPYNPFIISSYDTNQALDVYVSGNYAYVAEYLEGANIFDISNLSNPILASNINLGHGVQGIIEHNDYAYLGTTHHGLYTFDVADPYNPILVDSNDPAIQNLCVSGNFLFGGSYFGSMRTFSISEPANPVFVTSLDTYGSYDIFESNNFIFVADSYQGLIIIQIGD